MKKILKTIIINLLVLIALLMIVDFSSMIIVDTATASRVVRNKLIPQTPKKQDVRSVLINYKHTSWAKTHFEEFNSLPTDYKSYFGWRRKKYKGETINIDSLGIRKTTGITQINAPLVVFLGGSTIWGTGANDQNTIPSLFKKKTGNSYNVLNYGESGYSAYQSLIFLQTQISKGLLDSISLIISYDGVNNSFFNRKYFSHTREVQINNLLHNQNSDEKYLFFKYTRTLIKKIKSKYNSPPPVLNPTTNFTDIDYKNCAIELLNTWVMMQNLSKSIGSDFICVLQPNIFVGSPNLNNLPNSKDLHNRKKSYEFYKYINELISTKDEYKQLKKSFIDMTTTLDNIPNVYIDFCHLSPNGNELITDNLLNYLEIK